MSGQPFSSQPNIIKLSPLTAGSFMKFIFYGAIIVSVIIFVLLMLHYTTFGVFSLDPTSSAIITVPIGVSGVSSAYETSTIPIYESTRFKNVQQINYTVSFDIYISNAIPTGDYQVIFYNGLQIKEPSKPACGQECRTDCDCNMGKYLTKGPTGSGMNVANTRLLSAIQNSLFNINSNLCMYLSPDKNDLNLMYYIAGSVSNAIPNMPDAVVGSKWVPGTWNIGQWIQGTGSNSGTGSWGSGGSGSWGAGGSGSWKPIMGPNCGPGKTLRYGDDRYVCESDSSGSGSEANGWITTYGPVGAYNLGPGQPSNRDARTITIENVPLNKAFRITLAVDPNFIEVYMNGDLVITAKTPTGSELYIYPSDGKSGTNFMGPPDFSPYCKVGNITYWNQVLPAKSIRLFSSKPADNKIFTQA